MATTLKDIAKIVGVSTNTVSRALKDMPDIGENTKNRIKETADLLGYRPNLTARSLVLQKTMLIGAAFTELDNPLRMEFSERLRMLASKDGYKLLISALDFDWGNKNLNIIEELMALKVDGLIIGSVFGLVLENPIGKILRECNENQKPVVLFGEPETNLVNTVKINYKDSAIRITNYILEKNIKDIVFFGNQKNSRFFGFESAMKEKELSANFVDTGKLSLENAKNAITEYLNEYKKAPQAIVAENDIAALGIIRGLKNHNINVPANCKVCSFDNIAMGKYSVPSLSSIGFDNGDMAKIVWGLLHKQLKESSLPSQQIELKQELFSRESC